MYNVTNPKTGKTYTYRDLRRANGLASKLGVKVVSTSTYRFRDGSTMPVESTLDWTGDQRFATRCPHGGIVGYCDRGACDE